MKSWQCLVCKYIFQGEEPPDKCPVCGAAKDRFVLLEPPESRNPEPAGAPAAAVVPPDTGMNIGEPAPGPPTLYDKVTRLMLRHHAHPVMVHTPNGILPAAVVLFILAWISGSSLLVQVGFINLIFVLLALPAVLFTGFVEWEKKYSRADTLLFKIKIVAAALTTASCIICALWYYLDPGVLSSSLSWIFILVALVMLISAGIAGHIGGKLVFKD